MAGLPVPPAQHFGCEEHMAQWWQKHDPRSKGAPNFDIMKHVTMIRGMPVIVIQVSHPKCQNLENDGYLEFLVRPCKVLKIDSYTVGSVDAPKNTDPWKVVCNAWHVSVFYYPTEHVHNASEPVASACKGNPVPRRSAP